MKMKSIMTNVVIIALATTMFTACGKKKESSSGAAASPYGAYYNGISSYDATSQSAIAAIAAMPYKGYTYQNYSTALQGYATKYQSNYSGSSTLGGIINYGSWSSWSNAGTIYLSSAAAADVNTLSSKVGNPTFSTSYGTVQGITVTAQTMSSNVYQVVHTGYSTLNSVTYTHLITFVVNANNPAIINPYQYSYVIKKQGSVIVSGVQETIQ